MLPDIIEILLPPRLRTFLFRNVLRVAGGVVALAPFGYAVPGSVSLSEILLRAVAVLAGGWFGGRVYDLTEAVVDRLFGPGDSSPRS